VQGFAGALQGKMLPPAKYVVRYEAPGDEPREETVSVTSGATTTVVVTAEGITIPPPPPASPSGGPTTCGAGKCG
jgi:hypothetical protein